MVEAYVLIQAKPGPAGQGVSKEVATIQGIISAEDVSGPYDVIARGQARNLDEFARLVVAKIQTPGRRDPYARLPSGALGLEARWLSRNWRQADP